MTTTVTNKLVPKTITYAACRECCGECEHCEFTEECASEDNPPMITSEAVLTCGLIGDHDSLYVDEFPEAYREASPWFVFSSERDYYSIATYEQRARCTLLRMCRVNMMLDPNVFQARPMEGIWINLYVLESHRNGNAFEAFRNVCEEYHARLIVWYYSEESNRFYRDDETNSLQEDGFVILPNNEKVRLKSEIHSLFDVLEGVAPATEVGKASIIKDRETGERYALSYEKWIATVNSGCTIFTETITRDFGGGTIRGLSNTERLYLEAGELDAELDIWGNIKAKGGESRRQLESMPFDKRFDLVDGGEGLCHATGYEVNWSNPEDFTEWWNEYIDSEGNLYYGR